MEDFVAAFGDVPDGARKLGDYEARHHTDIWIQRLLGEGVVCNYVLAYQLEGRRWTFCFDRLDGGSEADEEPWVVETYDSDGRSLRRPFLYNPALAQWTRGPVEHWPIEARLPPASSGRD